MKFFKIIIVFLVLSKLSYGQISSTLNNIPTIGIKGYYYESENILYDGLENIEDVIPQDTLFLPKSLPFKKSCNIYFDITKKNIATIIIFDTLLYRIISKHYNRKGQLIKEQKI